METVSSRIGIYLRDNWKINFNAKIPADFNPFSLHEAFNGAEEGAKYVRTIFYIIKTKKISLN